MIGERIQKIRREKGLTEQALAEKAQISLLDVIQIENSATVPSMNVILQLADALNSSFAALVSPEKERGKAMIIKKDDRTKIKQPDSSTEYEFLTPYASDCGQAPQIEMVLYKLEPENWVYTDAVIHPESAECSVVLEGTIEFHVNDEVFTLNAGDSIYLPANIPHKAFNPGDRTTTVLGILTPGYYQC